MMILFNCPSCGKQLAVPDEFAGKQARCPGCQQVLTVSAQNPESSASILPSPPSAQTIDVPPMPKRAPETGAAGPGYSPPTLHPIYQPPPNQGAYQPQPPGYYMPYGPPTPGLYATKLPQGKAIAALVLGLCSLPFACFCWLGAIPGITAIILGIFSIRGCLRWKERGMGMAVVGVVTGTLGILFGLAQLFFLAAMFQPHVYPPVQH